MSVISDLKHSFESFGRAIKTKILGVNNERLEFLMDSFYKLEPNYRNGFLVGIVGMIMTFVMFAVFLYFVQVQSLRDDLNNSFNALNELKYLKSEDSIESARFDKLVEKVNGKTRGINFKPFFERSSREANISLKSLADKQPEMDPHNPLSKKLQEVHIDMRVSKVSIPRLLKFLVDVEKSNHYLRVQNLKITGIYGNKLYFDADILVRGYKVVR